MIQDKTQSTGNGMLYKDCNAALDHLGCSLRASREAVVRGVAPLAKDAPLPARRAWRFFYALWVQPLHDSLNPSISP